MATPRLHSLALALLTALAVFTASGVVSAQDSQNDWQVRFEGELLDENQRPISGVFPMTFKVYSTEEASQPSWSEEQFVAVHLGEYVVMLGSETALPTAIRDREVWIGITLGSLGEVVRNPKTMTPWVATAPAAAANVNSLQFADIADRALYADQANHAEDCDTLSGIGIEELNRYQELEAQIAELRQRVRELAGGNTGGGGGTIGRRTVTLEGAGGSGGHPYTYNCPPNHVAVGMTGGAGNLVDSVALICAPLE